MLQDAERNDEALAMIAGWNAVVSYEKKQQGKTNLSLQEVIGDGFGYEQYFLDETAIGNKKDYPYQRSEIQSRYDCLRQPKEIPAHTYYDQSPEEARLGRTANRTTATATRRASSAISCASITHTTQKPIWSSI